MTKKKIAIAIAAAALAGTCAIGGTLAWLTDTANVTNAFTVGAVDVDVKETKKGPYKIYPGAEIAKDPTLTVKADSENCYLFAYIDDGLSLEDGTSVAEFDIVTPETDPKPENAAIWDAVEDEPGLYVLVDEDGNPKVVTTNAADQSFDLFTTVTIDGAEVTMDNINELEGKEVIIYAYAHQSEGIGDNGYEEVVLPAAKAAFPVE